MFPLFASGGHELHPPLSIVYEIVTALHSPRKEVHLAAMDLSL
jgi:hypothetical protein